MDFLYCSKVFQPVIRKVTFNSFKRTFSSKTSCREFKNCFCYKISSWTSQKTFHQTSREHFAASRENMKQQNVDGVVYSCWGLWKGFRFHSFHQNSEMCNWRRVRPSCKPLVKPKPKEQSRMTEEHKTHFTAFVTIERKVLWTIWEKSELKFRAPVSFDFNFWPTLFML